MDKILQYFAGEQFQDEIRLAKREFFENSSVFDESSPHFELRMSQFFDWYFFSRKLKGFDCTPLEASLVPRELKFTPAEVEMVGILKQFQHSIFEFVKTKDNDLCIKDLFTDKKLWVKDSAFTKGFQEVELFQVRLIPYGDSFVFTRGFCFHPPEARKYILKEVKRYRKNPDLNVDDLLLRLLKLRYKYEQYKHVSVDMVYCDPNT
jgi:hypothetical protein